MVLIKSTSALEEQGRCSLEAFVREEQGSVPLGSPSGSELLKSQGQCSSGAGAKSGSCQEQPSPTTRALSYQVFLKYSILQTSMSPVPCPPSWFSAKRRLQKWFSTGAFVTCKR